jgi:excisionase family DNA binding protein
MPSEPRLSDLRLLTVAEVAEMTRLSRMTIYRLVNSGRLPALKIGRTVRIPEQAVWNYLKGCTSTMASLSAHL